MVALFRILSRAGVLGCGLLGALCSVAHTVQAAHTDDDAATRPAATEAQPRQYKVALGASGSLGDAGWGTELGNILQLYGRYQLYRGLGVGASYFWLAAPNNEGNSWPQTNLQALEGFAEYHPFETSWLDPFARLGVLGLTHVEGSAPVDRFGLEGVLGLDFVLPHVALGLHARSGFTNRHWTMVGLHTEMRF